MGFGYGGGGGGGCCLLWSLGALDLGFGAGALGEDEEFRGYAPPEVNRIDRIWGFYCNIPKYIFYLLKGDWGLGQVFGNLDM